MELRSAMTWTVPATMTNVRLHDCGSGSGTGTGSAPATETVVEPLSWKSFEAWYERWRRTVLTKEEHEASELYLWLAKP